MNSIVRYDEMEEMAVRPTRAGLSRYLSRLTLEVGADSYMLVHLARHGVAQEAQIIASNWIYDTIGALGLDAIQRLALAPCTTFMSVAPRIWRPEEAAAENILDRDQADALQLGGHQEVVAARIRAGGAYCAFFSARHRGSIMAEDVPAACLTLSYALASLSEQGPAAAKPDVSDRERECLSWVSEGKTTDEVAMILGVSSNTVNSYLTHAIQKLSARNRAMAIATAIRTGII